MGNGGVWEACDDVWDDSRACACALGLSLSHAHTHMCTLAAPSSHLIVSSNSSSLPFSPFLLPKSVCLSGERQRKVQQEQLLKDPEHQVAEGRRMVSFPFTSSAPSLASRPSTSSVPSLASRIFAVLMIPVSGRQSWGDST